MGRLDDIVARNKKAMKGDGLLLKGVGALVNKPTDPTQHEPDIAGARRKTTSSPIIVIGFMLLLALVIGFFTCRGMERDRADREQRMQQQTP